jgi:holliday junction DNA helicase RuvA
MIGFLAGKVSGRTPDGCLLDVGGVGYALSCSGATLASLPPDGGKFKLLTHLHVREDALVLFGFATEAERQIFEALLSVSGVGPKVAQAVCAVLAPDQFRSALATDDVDAIAAVPGIGKKTAQRIVIDLKEKMAVPDLQVVNGAPDTIGQARSALENLGYSPGEVRAALAEVASSANGNVEEVVRNALKVLS